LKEFAFESMAFDSTIFKSAVVERIGKLLPKASSHFGYLTLHFKLLLLWTA